MEISAKKFDYAVNPTISIRSAVIQVFTLGRLDNEEMFGSGVTISFKIDVIRKFEILIESPWDELCLGIADPLTKKWICHSRDPPQKSSINTLEIQKMDYIIDRPGIYAVILSPVFNPHQKDTAYMGMIMLHKKMVIALLFFGMPLLIILFGVFTDIVNFESKCMDITEDRKFIKEQVTRMANVTCDF